MTYDPTAIADYGDTLRLTRDSDTTMADRVLRGIVRADVRPFAEDIRTWCESDDAAECRRYHTSASTDPEYMLDNPRGRTYSMPYFFSWMRQQRRGPFAAEPPVVTPATVEQIVQIRPLTPENIAPWRKTLVRWVTEVGPSTAYLDSDWLSSADDDSNTLAGVMHRPNRFFATMPIFGSWLRERGQTEPDPAEPAVPQGDNVIPIGPEHPGWAAFWERIRTTASGNGYSGYYEQIARAFGVVTRERYSMRVTYEVVVDADSPQDADAQVRAMVHSRSAITNIQTLSHYPV